MCRSIKRLRVPGQPATGEELHAASLQFVRKISGFQKPSRANQEAFDRAVRDIAQASRVLLESLTSGQGVNDAHVHSAHSPAGH